MYGRTSLISFLQRLFGMTPPKERQNFNYYFSLKQHLNLMENHKEGDRLSMELLESEEIEQPKNSPKKQALEKKINQSRMVIDANDCYY
jgi:hypothetical protein